MISKPNKIGGTINFKPISNIKASFSLLINELPFIFSPQPANRHKNNAFKGINRLDVAKSRKSNIVFLRIVILLSVLKDNAAGIAIADIIKNNIPQAFSLVILYLSIIAAIGTSIILIPDVSAAAKSKIKKAPEIISPCGICEKI